MMATKTLDTATPRRSRTVMTLVFHDKNEREVKKIVVTDNNFMLIVIAPIVAWLLLSAGYGELVRAERRNAIESLRPQMEALATQGHDEASLWVAKNNVVKYRDRIASLATKGVPEAMYMHGVLLEHGGDKASGAQWIERAAARGNAAAIQHAADVKLSSH